MRQADAIAERVKTVMVRGRRYRLEFPARMADHGSCSNPHAPDRSIRVRRRLRDLPLLDTLIHEMLHAGLWDLDEEAIDAMGRDIAVALWRMGWRLT